METLRPQAIVQPSFLMASPAILQPKNSFLLKRRSGSHLHGESHLVARISGLARRRNNCCYHVTLASAERPQKQQKAPPGVDTRIHWDNPDEGWIGGSKTSSSKGTEEEEQKNLLGDKFSDLLNESSDSHYQFLGVSAEADLEEIKAAYRRLSKEYHPDTTSLPLKTASDKFLKLREVYNVLSDEEKRRFYDWTLAQEAASRQAEKMRMKLEDPYEQDVRNWKPVPEVVDRLGGRNMDLSDQAKSALTIDIFALVFAICCIIYVLYFKEAY